MPACQHASPLYDRTVQSLGHRARWGIGGYATLALACTVAWLLLGSQAAERNGLRRELFLVNGFVGQPFRQEVSDGISLDFLDDDDRLPRQRFGVRWRGYWYVPDDGPLVIHGEGDDRLNVHVDGELVLRRYPPEEMHRAAGTVALAAGVHELLIEYEQEGGAYALDVRWSPPSDRTRPFAGYRMFHERPSMEDVRLAERGRVARLGCDAALGGASRDGSGRRGAAGVAGARPLWTGIPVRAALERGTTWRPRTGRGRGGGSRSRGAPARPESALALARRSRVRCHHPVRELPRHGDRTDPCRPRTACRLALAGTPSFRIPNGRCSSCRLSAASRRFR